MPQLSATISAELISKIKEIAQKERRSISAMVEILLERAVSERNRKRKGGGDD